MWAGVVWGECPEAVQVVGEYDPRIDVEGVLLAGGADGVAEFVYFGDEQPGVAVAQVDGEEVGAAGDSMTTVGRHGAPRCGRGGWLALVG
jgi:hypothetical protein